MKTCGIHDLLRDLCLKEAQKEMFLCVFKTHNHAQPINNERRVVFHEDWSHQIDCHRFDRALQSTTFIRSLTCDFIQRSSPWHSTNHLRLLRVLTKASTQSLESILQLVNLKYLKCDLRRSLSAVLCPMCRLWYLQTLILRNCAKEVIAPKEIWEMPQLRHMMINKLCLPDPSYGQTNRHDHDDFVLKNLQTLSWIKNFKCTEDILRRISNITKLWIMNQETGTSNHCIHNLVRLHKLQSLTCYMSRETHFFQNVAFPHSLNKLRSWNCYFDWDDITENVGSLPHLEKLRLSRCHSGAEWNTVKGKFPRLKFLEISLMENLVYWKAESTHFPLLESLLVKFMTRLKIPPGIGDTLQSIELVFCGLSIVASAKEI